MVIPLINDTHNRVAVRVQQGIVPQAIIVRSHGIAFGAAGVMTVSDKADGYSCRFCTHFCTVTIHAVKQCPFLIVFALRGHKCTAIAEGKEFPYPATVVPAKPVHPAKNVGFEGYPLRYAAKLLRPEADAVLIGDLGGGNLVLSCDGDGVCGCEQRQCVARHVDFPCV